MSNQEKEFKYLTEKLLPDYLDDKEEILCLANDLIKVYPQILAEKVGDWDYELTKRGSRKYYFFTENPVESIFIREVVS